MLSVESFVSNHFQHEYITYGSPVTDLRVNCPFCVVRYGKADHKHKLYISIHTQVCHCFRCNYKNSWVGLVMDLTGLSYAHALGELYTKPRVSKFDNVIEGFNVWEAHNALHKSQLPDDFEFMHNWYDFEFPSTVNGLMLTAYNYLKSRGFSQQHWDRYNLGVAPSIGMRVVIPIEDDYWQARALFGFMHPKYMSPKVENRHYLFNSIALDAYKQVVICEGAFSAMAVGWNAVATLSHNITTEQMRRLRKAPVEHYVIASEPGFLNNSMEHAESLSRAGKRVTIWDYQEGDPAEPGEMNVIEYDVTNKIKALLYSWCVKSHQF